MDAAEKRQRDLELLRKSRKALDEGELVDRHAPPPPQQEERRQAPPREGDPDVMMYRGKAVRRKGSSGTPSSGTSASARGGQFRGATAAAGSKPAATPSSGDVRAILERLNGLYKDGLITKAEYDRKRNQILDRL